MQKLSAPRLMFGILVTQLILWMIEAFWLKRVAMSVPEFACAFFSTLCLACGFFVAMQFKHQRSVLSVIVLQLLSACYFLAVSVQGIRMEVPFLWLSLSLWIYMSGLALTVWIRQYDAALHRVLIRAIVVLFIFATLAFGEQNELYPLYFYFVYVIAMYLLLLLPPIYLVLRWRRLSKYNHRGRRLLVVASFFSAGLFLYVIWEGIPFAPLFVGMFQLMLLTYYNVLIAASFIAALRLSSVLSFSLQSKQVRRELIFFAFGALLIAVTLPSLHTTFLLLSGFSLLWQLRTWLRAVRSSSKEEDGREYVSLLSYLEWEKGQNELFSHYLHDEVLQDIIHVKKRLMDERGLSSSEPEVSVLDGLILSIRHEMDLYSPYFISKRSLYHNYEAILDRVAATYSERRILVEFFCDRDLYLSAPYDEIVYRFLSELVTNVYKHSEAVVAEVHIRMENGRCIVEVWNDGNVRQTPTQLVLEKSSGLSGIYRTVKRMGGAMESSNEDGYRVRIVFPLEGGDRENTMY